MSKETYGLDDVLGIIRDNYTDARLWIEEENKKRTYTSNHASIIPEDRFMYLRYKNKNLN